MPGTEHDARRPGAPLPLLFLLADTGGGHRSAARAVSDALELAYPGRFGPVLCDPLHGPGSARPLRWVTGLYGPVVRVAPWLWGAAYYATNSRPAMWLLRHTLLRPAGRAALEAIRANRPAAIVSFHPLTGMAGSWARDRVAPLAPVVTVVTDLASMHAAWRYGDAELIIAAPGIAARHAPSAGRRGRGKSVPRLGQARSAGLARGAWAAAGPPASPAHRTGPLPAGERARLRQSVGLTGNGLAVLLTGGAEGSGGLGRRAAAILRRFPDTNVVVVCGRNVRLRRRLARLTERSGGRLTVIGLVDNMGDWLHCCDLVVTKAGPGIIAEAACSGTPLLLTTHLPGQEKGNAEIVTDAGAGLRARGVRRLIAEIGRLHRDRTALAAMGEAATRLAWPQGARDIADLIAGLIPALQTAASAGGPPLITEPARTVPAMTAVAASGVTEP